MENKGWDAVDVRAGDANTSAAKEDTSCSRPVHTLRPNLAGERRKPSWKCRSLVSLCVGNLGRHLEDIIEEIHLVAPTFPPSVKASLLAVARRRDLLCDELLVALADESWEFLDVSGSDITDASIETLAKVCPRLQAVDISRCSRLTPRAVRVLVQHSPSLHTIRWGGTSLSNSTARLALTYILPKLNLSEEAEDSWEELDIDRVGKGGQALRWLVWPSIDEKSRERLETECPRVVVNPKPFSRGFQHLSVPWEAWPATVLDAGLVEDLDPETWAVRTSRRVVFQNVASRDSSVLSIAERFKLAFISRDERLAPKRAKNSRQNQRRAEKAWLNSDTEAKARAWAGVARRSLKGLEG
ncbi:hypothetical protein MPTK1_1g19080 [Marchantia polymorpha subsp. ruderalis]|uniref:Uncharacterized protein n=2 Tax=Marchantia polymorpha TaxID=3197 RepID=A0AAF6ARS0_MARPO|nr:hypothetical protein MARPO_0001s0246 [Marchantia polymorpha]BBM99140.1 hypothetical protein Mp_1g19080 [Marchantia polymorpha subsp. ruderalis]|eukprot:PTQ50217.1 hypothetical protein MARPO_0001s0246 [Marchantia polymorpha]